MSSHKRPRDTEESRTDCLSSDDYFMAVACLSRTRSKDPKIQVGACIVSADNKIVGTGYNSMPNGWSDDDLSWKKKVKHLYVCHAEMNAIVNAHIPDLAGCRIYVTLYPCNECAKLIITAGIKEVYYLHKKYSVKTKYVVNETLLEEAGVKTSPYKPKWTTLSLGHEESEESHAAPEGTSTTSSNASKTSQKEDYLCWRPYFMAMAKLTSFCSKDPSTKVGACIVAANGRIVGLGYNDMPPGCKERWEKMSKKEEENKYPYVCHAGVNAVMHRTTGDVSGSTLYTTHFPYQESVKVIIQAGIKEIIYDTAKYNSDRFEAYKPAAEKMLKRADVQYSSFDAVMEKKVKIVINCLI